jgi:MFS family permease
MTRVTPAAWRMLALAVAGQAAGAMLVSTPAYLIPLWHLHDGLSLTHAGLLTAAPNVGTLLTLVLWGALADRHGERWVIAGGLALTAVFAAVAAAVSDPAVSDPAVSGPGLSGYLPLGVALLFGGAAAASSSAASGRVVAGWFPRESRGLAMGIRQMAQPLGVSAAAIAVPPLAQRFGVWAPLLLAGALAAILAVACAIGITDPPRPAAVTAAVVSPYRGNLFLARIHLVSALLVVPQFTLSTFGLVWLVAGLGWSAGAAGAVIAGSQLIGALGRIAVGRLSDQVGSRVRVLRWVAVSGVAVMLALAAIGALSWPAAAAVVLVVATTVSVADNGLSFTAVAEAAGPFWSGRALGVQNTGQFLAAAVVGPGIGALLTTAGYPLTFALVALTPLTAFPLVPARDRHYAAPADANAEPSSSHGERR